MKSVIDKLNAVEAEASEAVSSSVSAEVLEEVRTRFLGRKGELTQIMRTIGLLPPDERKDLGQKANKIKEKVFGENFYSRLEQLAESKSACRLTAEALDVTLPGRFYQTGRPHILVETLSRIKQIFIGLGYEFVETPEIELYEYNFEALNYPEEHPALDEQMSFYIDDKHLLRTHTTAYQYRVMIGRKPPMRVATMGKCYRSDAVDATHNHTFHQVDCFAIDRGISMADLKGTIHQFAVEMFGRDMSVRFRPDFFPFVEPGAEFAVTCVICGGDGCNVCKGTGWLEIGGAGLIHPNILEAAGIDSEEYSGFAFGFGIERMPMLMNGVNDLRLFLDNDLRFLRQL